MGTTKRRDYGHGSLSKLKDGRWRIRAYAGKDPTGRFVQKSRTVAGTKKEAEAALVALRAELAAGQHGATPAKAVPTVSAILDAWVKDVEGRGKPQTIRGVRLTVESVFRPALGAFRLDEFGPAELEDFYRAMKAAGRAPGTIRRYHAQLSAAFAIGVRHGLIEVNPAKQARPPAPEDSEIQPPSVDEIRRLMEAAEKSDPVFKTAIALLAVTGMRRGELCGLRWSDVDIQRGVLDIRRSVGRGIEDGTIEITTPKTQRARRRVSLDDAAVMVLQDHRLYMEAQAGPCGGLVADPYLFAAYPDGSEPMNPERLTSLISRLRGKLGLPHLRLHDLRHYLASTLIADGVNVRKVSAVLGHSRTSITLDTYAHVFDELERDSETARIAGRLLSG